MVTDEFVFFCGMKTEGEEKCLSNFYRSQMGWFPTNEHYYMFQKASFFNDINAMRDIMGNGVENTTPREAKEIGRRIVGFSDELWVPVKLKYMAQGLKLKFDSNSHLKQYLISTGNKIIVEAAPWDPYWGIGMSYTDPNVTDQTKWKGLNQLGNLLMSLRKYYLEQKENEKFQNSTTN